MRLAPRDVRDLIVSQKNDHGPSYWRYGASQRWSCLKCYFREILGVVRFSTFATKSATSRLLHRSETLLSHQMLGTKLRLVTVAVASRAFYSRCCQTITAFVSIRSTLSWLNSSWW
jgi:hypothetical protein